MSSWGSGHLPAGWAWVPLGELGERISSTTTPDPDAVYELWSVPAFPSGSPEVVAGREIGSAKVLVEPGDLLICKINPRINRVWVVGSNRGLPQLASPEWVVLRPAGAAGDQTAAFLRHACSAPGFRSVINAQVSSVTGSHARAKPADVLAAPVPIAPVAVQKQIVAALDQQFPHLDSALQDAEALHRHLQQLEEAVIRAAVLGRLVPGVTGAAHAAVHLAAALDTVTSPDTPGLPALPAGWTWTTLGALCDVTGGVTKDAKKQNDPDYVEVPYLRVANVQKGHLDLSEVARIRVSKSKADALRLLPGDVLFNEGGDRDKLGRGWVWEGQIRDCIHQNHVFRGRIRGGVLDPRLLSWHGNTFGRRWFESAGKQTTNLASLSMTNLKRLPVPVPPLEDQGVIVAEVQRRLSIIKAARDDIAAVRRKTQVLRLSLLHKAFAGGLDTQDCGDEPAELLLKRIAEDRALAPSSARRRRVRTVPAARADAGAPPVEESA
ncbi:hypothetical protein [Geodermatophilus sp. SYSU D01105]